MEWQSNSIKKIAPKKKVSYTYGLNSNFVNSQKTALQKRIQPIFVALERGLNVSR